MLEDPGVAYTYLTRDAAPDIFLLGNLGGSQLVRYKTEQIIELVRAVGADGMTIHLNPLHELVQPDGDVNWRDVLAAITDLCRLFQGPVVVKEVGCGLSGQVARLLQTAGVSALDAAGAGGTSFARVEHYRGSPTAATFFECGIPTAESLRQCLINTDLPVIASGGIRNGLECAKALAMGAGLAGFAFPLLKPALTSAEAVMEVIERVCLELKIAMMLLGARNITELRNCRLNFEKPAPSEPDRN